MATIIQFPADAPARRPRSGASQETMGTVLILPAVRIERESNGPSDDRGPREGTAPSRRRRRR